MPEAQHEDPDATQGAAAADSESNRIVLEQANLTISRIRGLLQRIPAHTR